MASMVGKSNGKWLRAALARRMVPAELVVEFVEAVPKSRLEKAHCDCMLE